MAVIVNDSAIYCTHLAQKVIFQKSVRYNKTCSNVMPDSLKWKICQVGAPPLRYSKDLELSSSTF